MDDDFYEMGEKMSINVPVLIEIIYIGAYGNVLLKEELWWSPSLKCKYMWNSLVTSEIASFNKQKRWLPLLL